MSINDIFNKGNIDYFGKLIRTISRGILIRIMLALIFIALIVDIMLTHTFPAYTLIAGIIVITTSSCKNLISKEDKKYIDFQIEEQKAKFEDTYNEIEPFINHLAENERNILKRFIEENKKCIEISQDEYKIVTGILAKGIFFIQPEPYIRMTDSFYLLKVTNFYCEILKKYFSK